MEIIEHGGLSQEWRMGVIDLVTSGMFRFSVVYNIINYHEHNTPN